MICEFYKPESECNFANKVYKKQASELTKEQADYISEFCTLCRGVGCGDKKSLVEKLNPQTTGK